jgi:hypothetical protein
VLVLCILEAQWGYCTIKKNHNLDDRLFEILEGWGELEVYRSGVKE